MIDNFYELFGRTNNMVGLDEGGCVGNAVFSTIRPFGSVNGWRFFIGEFELEKLFGIWFVN